MTAMLAASLLLSPWWRRGLLALAACMAVAAAVGAGLALWEELRGRRRG